MRALRRKRAKDEYINGGPGNNGMKRHKKIKHAFNLEDSNDL